MKKILLLMGVMALGACDSMRTKVGEEVRQVEVGDSLVSNGWNTVVYRTESDVSSLDLDSNEPELYVNLTDVATGTVFKVGLGGECRQWPLPRGERLLVRFDRSASKKLPQDIYISPQYQEVARIFC